MSTLVDQADTPVATHVRLAPVIPIERASRPRHTPTRAAPLPECLTDLLHGVQLNGSIDAVLPPGIAWNDVIAWAQTDSEPTIVIDELTEQLPATIAAAAADDDSRACTSTSRTSEDFRSNRSAICSRPAWVSATDSNATTPLLTSARIRCS